MTLLFKTGKWLLSINLIIYSQTSEDGKIFSRNMKVAIYNVYPFCLQNIPENNSSKKGQLRKWKDLFAKSKLM